MDKSSYMNKLDLSILLTLFSVEWNISLFKMDFPLNSSAILDFLFYWAQRNTF